MPYETGGGIRECRWRQVHYCTTSGGANRATTLRRGHDAIQSGGVKVPQDEFLQAHADLLRRDEWIIDGAGGVALLWERFAAADTLVYVDLPLLIHYTWVTKRLIKGLFADPKGWPEGSPLWSSTLSSYRVIPLCHRNLTPKYRLLVAEAAASKRVHHLRSVRSNPFIPRGCEEGAKDRGVKLKLLPMSPTADPTHMVQSKSVYWAIPDACEAGCRDDRCSCL